MPPSNRSRPQDKAGHISYAAHGEHATRESRCACSRRVGPPWACSDTHGRCFLPTTARTTRTAGFKAVDMGNGEFDIAEKEKTWGRDIEGTGERSHETIRPGSYRDMFRRDSSNRERNGWEASIALDRTSMTGDARIEAPCIAVER